MKGIYLIILLISSMSFSAVAYEESVLEITESHKVFYRYEKAQAGKPTIVLLNGLIYAIEHWDEYFTELTKDGFGVLQIAYSTQPESLRYLDEAPYYVEVEWTFQGAKQVGIETQDLVDEVMMVVDQLKIKRFNLLSLSFGSIVASELAVQKKDRIDNLIIVAPAVMSSHRYNAYGQSRHAFYSAQKALGFPIDYYYDLELYATMSTLVTPNKYSFDGVEFNDFFSGVYQMARSSKWFDLKDYSTKELPPLYLFLASLEDPPLLDDQLLFWDLLKVNEARRSLVMFEGGYHALPGVVPFQTAELTKEILRGSLAKGEYLKKVGNAPVDDGKKSSLVK